MQNLARTSSAGTSYTAAQVTSQLLGRVRQERWLFDRLNSSGRFLADLSRFVDWSQPPVVRHDARAAVKRTITLRIRGDATLTALSDLVRPHYQIQMPDGGWIDFALGTFTLTPTDKQISEAVTWRGFTGTDLSQLLVDAAFSNSTAVGTGAGYVAGIQQIVSTYGGQTPIAVQIPDSGKTLPAPLGWEVGKSRLQAVNDLLGGIGYLPAWFDELGVMRSSPLPNYTTVAPTVTFDSTGQSGVVKSPIVERADTSRAYNRVLIIGEDPRRTPIVASYTNSNPASPVSTVNWHPKLKVVRDSTISDAASAYARATWEVQQAARIYGSSTVLTPPWPASQDFDVYRLVYSTPTEGLVAQNYVEVGWQHVCRAGADTIHTLERVVAI